MLGYILLSLFASLISADSNALVDMFTPFNMNGTKSSYVVNGSICVVIIINGEISPTTCGPASLAIDPRNNRMIYNLGNLGGVYVVLKDSAYVYGNPLHGGACQTVANWNYAKQVLGYQKATALPGSRTNKAVYAGECDDVGTCHHSVSIVLEVINSVISLERFDQKVPLPFGPGGSSICVLSQGVIELDLDTLDRDASQIDAHFALPSSCATAQDYCDIAYPSGNPCAILQ
jgi:hypothetical protein